MSDQAERRARGYSLSRRGFAAAGVAAIAALVSLPASAWAQRDANQPISPPGLASEVRDVSVDSGMVRAEAAGDQPQVVFSERISAPDARWIRLRFEEASLAGEPGEDGAFLRITSLLDGAAQILDQTAIEQWGYTSAYFNGDRVRIELLSPAGVGPSRVVVEEITAGQPTPEPLTICGTDDRVLSDDPRAARLMPVGCTGYMIDDDNHCFLTAGHCVGFDLDVVQFNVPMSSGSGSTMNPPPKDQYPVDPASVQSAFGGQGNDWAYFGVFPNSNTGLTPIQAQGDYYTLADEAPPASNQTIRITGYGTDNSPPEHNQVQQTNSGPLVSSFGTILEYQVDTEGGSSGSPVINTEVGEVIGIHTNGGCFGGSGSNSGTAIHNSGLQNALANPQGVCALEDCNNNGVPDPEEIANGEAEDCNDNGVPDECEDIDSTGDLDGDGVVDAVDLGLLLGQWGSVEGEGAADINGDGVVDGADLGLLLGAWGEVCQ